MQLCSLPAQLAIEPSNPDYYFARAQAYENLLKYTEAKADYEKVLVFDPKNVDAVINLGAVCNKMNNYRRHSEFLTMLQVSINATSKYTLKRSLPLSALEKYDQALKVSDTAIND